LPLCCRHYGFGFAAGLAEHYLRGFHGRTAATFVPCHGLRDELEARGYARVEVIGRGVDARLYTPTRRSVALRLSWGAGARAPVFLCVGRPAREKNLPLAFEAYAAARRRHPSARMVVVGDGPLRAPLQHEHPEVHFAGLQQDERLAAHYASADVLLSPSLSETFGSVTLEAMASGLAVVAFDRAAAGALVDSGRNGWLVAPGDAGGFVATAAGLLDDADHDALVALRQRARTTALAHDWEPVQRAFEARLAELAAAPGRRIAPLHRAAWPLTGTPPAAR